MSFHLRRYFVEDFLASGCEDMHRRGKKKVARDGRIPALANRMEQTPERLDRFRTRTADPRLRRRVKRVCALVAGRKRT